MNDEEIEVCNCARCGKDHTIKFRKFIENAVELENGESLTHWGMCSNFNEPVLMCIKAKEVVNENS